jgi:hypothetical protein
MRWARSFPEAINACTRLGVTPRRAAALDTVIRLVILSDLLHQSALEVFEGVIVTTRIQSDRNVFGAIGRAVITHSHFEGLAFAFTIDDSETGGTLTA